MKKSHICATILSLFAGTAFSVEPLLDKETRMAVKKELAGLTEQVTLLVFTQKIKCQYCAQNDQLFKEIGTLSPKLKIKTVLFAPDSGEAAKYQVDKIPASLVMGKKERPLRFMGIPAGYEFASLIEAIKDASRGKSELSLALRQKAAAIKRPVHIQVLCTPT